MQASKRYILNFVILSVGYILLGLLLILAPEASKRIVCMLLGVVAVLMGIIRIAMHFAKDDLSRAFRNDIPMGVTLAVAGVYLFARPDAIWAWLPVILGFAVVYDSIVKLQHSFDLRRAGFGPWWGVLAAGLATAVLGVLLILGIFNNNILLYYFGAVMITDGVVNLVTITLFSTQMKKAEKAAASTSATPPLTPPQAAADSADGPQA